ncbi:MAG: class I SAM-dependent methyltransferase [Chloroflexi bacterium]|nr:class I SAM-dependent methyltransferase [Chloroflexota bacterium]MDA8187060.1 class I SAM-dependent methyltransferase [Dehalococcoidales bacterium]
MKRTVDELIERLESPERRQLMDLEAVLSRLPLTQSLAVADVGCGTGYFALPLGSKLANGLVYAIDVSPEMLAVVDKKIATEGRRNIDTVRSEDGKIPLSDESVDGVLTAFVLHEAENLPALLKEIGRILRSDGWLAVLEWKKEETPVGPALDERLAPEDVAGELAAMGISLVAVHDINENYYLALFARK